MTDKTCDCDPVGATEIANRAGVGRPTVEQWTRRHATFPEPRWTIGGRPAWNWPDVKEWLHMTKRIAFDGNTPPAFVAYWLDANRVPLSPDPAERGGDIWAEWDAHRDQIELGVWLSQNCPRCGETGPARMSLVSPPGFNDNNWQHGCGLWWAPARKWVTVADRPEDEVLADLNEMVTELRQRQDAGVAAIRKRLATDLREFLAEWTTEEDREENASGSEVEPGIWRPDDGEWEAWDYHPSSEGDTITVTESDL